MVGGGALLAVGVALLPLPGPGLLVVFAGLSLLATEFEVARRAQHLIVAKVRLARARAVRRRGATVPVAGDGDPNGARPKRPGLP